MLNLLNAMSALAIGIISLAIIVLIVVLFFVLNFKRGIARTGLRVGIFLISLIVAIFVSKPLLSLFDGLFAFSTVFFQFFMAKFAGITSLNVRVTASTLPTVVENFKTSDAGISSTVKQMLVDIFENTSIQADRATTLSAIASTTFSYLCALFIVGLVLFFVLYGLLSLIVNLITRHFGGKHEKRKLKPLSGIIGFFEGVIISIIILVSFSTIPFFGISTDFFASGFEKTVVLNTPYQFITKVERDVYKSTLNYTLINRSSSQNLDDIKIGTYNNLSNEDSKWTIYIVVQSKSESASSIQVGLTNKENSSINFAENCTYIYVDNSLYLFSSSNKLMAICKYDKKNKTLKYKKETEMGTIEEIVEYVSTDIG